MYDDLLLVPFSNAKKDVDTASDNLLAFFNNKVSINGEIGVSFSSPPIVGPNGELIYYNSRNGTYYVGDKSRTSLAGSYNDEEGKLIDAVIFVDTLTGNTKVMLTSKAGYSFGHNAMDKYLTSARSDLGVYTYVGSPLLATESRNFLSISGDKGVCIGLSFDDLNPVLTNHTKQEMLVSIDKALMEREREPETVTDKYKLLMYDILRDKKHSLASEEINIIQTKTLEYTQELLQNWEDLTQEDIESIAQQQSQFVIDLTKGKIYNPDMSLANDYEAIMNNITHHTMFDEYKGLLDSATE